MADESEEWVNLFDREEDEAAEPDAKSEDAVIEDSAEEVAATGEEDACEEPGSAGDAVDAAAEEAEDNEPASDVKDAKGDKKKKKKEEKKDKRDEIIADLNDKLLRQQAEFVNFRNRTEKEKAQMFEVGAKSAFEKILPVIDNFERGLATLSEEELQQPFAQGIEKTYRQLITALAEAGVTPIEAVGAPFDADLHNAVMHVEDDSVGENIVVEEFQKGYRYRDTVLRHSMVKVAN